ncbi:hypothetical protein ACFTS5_08670 [Nocardia sp. NPDC056952]|uniref:hypothetical protein n=1 Tax=Nocardia sp. NPDC056952 TaxID=3345979 RepID=UPI00363194A7
MPDDAERWRAQFVKPHTDYHAMAVEEGQKGYPRRNAQPVVHALHTPDRADEIRTVTGAADKRERGEAMRDRMLDAALAASA